MRYANNILTLKKEAPTAPFELHFSFLDSNKQEIVYLPDNKIFLSGMVYQNQSIVSVSTSFLLLLENLLLSITDYPYEWPLLGKKLDITGLDIYEDGSVYSLSPSAIATANQLLGFRNENLNQPYKEDKYVTAPHLTKLSVTLEKTTPLSQFSIQLHAVQPVRLASLIYESDLSGYSEAIELNLDSLQVSQSADNLTILFGKSILVKRMTFVLAQDSAEQNIGLPKTMAYDYQQKLLSSDESYVKNLLKRGAI